MVAGTDLHQGRIGSSQAYGLLPSQSSLTLCLLADLHTAFDMIVAEQDAK